jgi:hypothetical protein
MNNQVEIKVVDCSDSNMYYDLNGICETADFTFWTLVPIEMFNIWSIKPNMWNYENDELISLFNRYNW